MKFKTKSDFSVVMIAVAMLAILLFCIVGPARQHAMLSELYRFWSASLFAIPLMIMALLLNYCFSAEHPERRCPTCGQPLPIGRQVAE